MTRIPLFPLSAVLLPGGRMPLKIFEQRYLTLVRECMRSGESFGVIWIRHGSEVAERGSASPELGDWGTLARIVDWDQLEGGLLGITIEGGERFDLLSTQVEADGLMTGEVTVRSPAGPAALTEASRPLLRLLENLEAHPHVERMGLGIDHGDAWQVAWALLQLLPLQEHLKYELLGLDAIDEVVGGVNRILEEISGEA